ncbi:hypothetical protein DM01DRAFT_1377002 [Hesseltinella vesiculosa]|uniref:Uncharacterized protein n=1 Tax=Hesseltinella vesiculosa TaxID=101127 RepID=A0A1X2G8Y2_9FUNG|nr:hypothetical protein DM01DRAFT_1377002 [Hesseltinella vesiculosa]
MNHALERREQLRKEEKEKQDRKEKPEQECVAIAKKNDTFAQTIATKERELEEKRALLDTRQPTRTGSLHEVYRTSLGEPLKSSCAYAHFKTHDEASSFCNGYKSFGLQLFGGVVHVQPIQIDGINVVYSQQAITAATLATSTLPATPSTSTLPATPSTSTLPAVTAATLATLTLPATTADTLAISTLPATLSTLDLPTSFTSLR